MMIIIIVLHVCSCASVCQHRCQSYFVYFSDYFSFFLYINNDCEKVGSLHKYTFSLKRKKEIFGQICILGLSKKKQSILRIRIFVNLIFILSPDQIHLNAIYCDNTSSLIVKIQDIRFFTNSVTPFTFLGLYSLM